MKIFGHFLALFLLLSALPANAQLFKRDPGDELVQPDEEALQFPSPPKDENLLSFDPGYPANMNFYVDSASLKVGETDRIVRYTLVIKSASGGSNITYEALRCDTNERKIYAYGAPDGSWSATRDPQWKALDKEMYRRTLFDYFFCPHTFAVGSRREAIDALKNGGHPKAPFKQTSEQY